MQSNATQKDSFTKEKNRRSILHMLTDIKSAIDPLSETANIHVPFAPMPPPSSLPRVDLGPFIWSRVHETTLPTEATLSSVCNRKSCPC